MEKIRVNISENGSYIVPDKDLQNKKERYYFTEAINLFKGRNSICFTA